MGLRSHHTTTVRNNSTALIKKELYPRSLPHINRETNLDKHNILAYGFRQSCTKITNKRYHALLDEQTTLTPLDKHSTYKIHTN